VGSLEAAARTAWRAPYRPAPVSLSWNRLGDTGFCERMPNDSGRLWRDRPV